ncbi:MAG TPA: type II CAAX endopeptidase family protein [Bacteroidales bacterium]|mgnify:FL=1|nr:type II CAAX endopeptidase family protein [Bacteroidales bacterium]HOG66314.1 type II CAAX endopeptidase family protein [Bacteroidales bacterium]
MNKSKRNLLIVLVGFPLIYFVYSLTPWANKLFVKGNSDLFIPFWSGIIVLHWISVLIVRAFLKQENKSFRDIGYGLNKKKTVIFVLSYLAIALLVFGFTEWSLKYVSIDENKLAGLSNFFPKTTNQRIFFILTVFTAGFCEEIVYRGYAITKLIDIRVNKWLAIIPAGIAFTLTHGIVAVTAYSQFFFYFAFAVVFGVIFVSGKRLLPNMIIHILFDLTAMMAIFQAISG